MKISDIKTEDRPRERLIMKGAAALSDAELLAILLRTGYGKANAIDLAYQLLEDAGNLTGMAAMTVEKMSGTPGIGKNKASSIAAAFELGRRFSSEGPKTKKLTITGSGMVYDLMIPLLKGLDHEECWVIFLNRANRVITKEKTSMGGMHSTVMDTKSIVRRAIENKASGIILVHNHPSGNPYPGEADRTRTLQLKDAANALEISLLDHVVIADDCYYSFCDESIGYP